MSDWKQRAESAEAKITSLTDTVAKMTVERDEDIDEIMIELTKTSFALDAAEAEVAKLREALHNAKWLLIALGGDPLTIIAEHGSASGDDETLDQLAATLDQIDAALTTGATK